MPVVEGPTKQKGCVITFQCINAAWCAVKITIAPAAYVYVYEKRSRLTFGEDIYSNSVKQSILVVLLLAVSHAIRDTERGCTNTTYDLQQQYMSYISTAVVVYLLCGTLHLHEHGNDFWKKNQKGPGWRERDGRTNATFVEGY